MLRHDPLQSTSPAPHEFAHTPAEQTCPAPHAVSHAPQCMTSALKVTHCAPHACWPAGQFKTHTPATHASVLPQAWPQLPQLSAFVRTSVQASPHSVSVALQVVASMPVSMPVSTGRLSTATSDASAPGVIEPVQLAVSAARATSAVVHRFRRFIVSLAPASGRFR